MGKMSAVPVIAPAYQKPIRTYVKQKEYMQKKFLFFPFQFIPWVTGYYRTVWQVKPFISDQKRPGEFG